MILLNTKSTEQLKKLRKIRENQLGLSSTSERKKKVLLTEIDEINAELAKRNK
jgi:hypothetical protein